MATATVIEAIKRIGGGTNLYMLAQVVRDNGETDIVLNIGEDTEPLGIPNRPSGMSIMLKYDPVTGAFAFVGFEPYPA